MRSSSKSGIKLVVIIELVVLQALIIVLSNALLLLPKEIWQLTNVSSGSTKCSNASSVRSNITLFGLVEITVVSPIVVVGFLCLLYSFEVQLLQHFIGLEYSPHSEGATFFSFFGVHPLRMTTTSSSTLKVGQEEKGSMC